MMSEKRFKMVEDSNGLYSIFDTEDKEDEPLIYGARFGTEKIVDLLNEQQEFIEELEVSDEMGWKRAEHFEKKCPKELHNKKMYIKRLEYKVQKFKEMNSKQQTTIEHLKQRLYDFEKRKIIEESTIDEDVIPKIKLLRTELFGEKYE